MDVAHVMVGELSISRTEFGRNGAIYVKFQKRLSCGVGITFESASHLIADFGDVVIVKLRTLRKLELM